MALLGTPWHGTTVSFVFANLRSALAATHLPSLLLVSGLLNFQIGQEVLDAVAIPAAVPEVVTA